MNKFLCVALLSASFALVANEVQAPEETTKKPAVKKDSVELALGTESEENKEETTEVSFTLACSDCSGCNEKDRKDA